VDILVFKTDQRLTDTIHSKMKHQPAYEARSVNSNLAIMDYCR